MRLGFVGTGALTSAIVRGLKSLADEDFDIIVSPRNPQMASDLAARHKGVRVASDNQAVLDESETVMLAVRPQIARDVLPALRFRPDHHVVTLIAPLSLEDIGALVAPATRITKALPMPMVAERIAPTIIFPPDPAVTALFDRLGKAMAVEDAAEFNALSVATATFATYFTLLDTLHNWLAQHGVGDKTAHDYTVTLFKALAHAPDTLPGASFVHLAQEYMTRGGLNEQVVRELSEQGVFNSFAESLDGIHRRIRSSQS